MHALLLQFTRWLSPYYSEIALLVIATLLVIYGDKINKIVKQALAPYHFLLRTLAFVFLCAFGYGAFILYLTPFVKQVILLIPAVYQGISLVGIFMLLGYLAERRRYI